MMKVSVLLLAAVCHASIPGRRETRPDGTYAPSYFEVCAKEGGDCVCNGVVILGDSITNLWSEPAEGTGSVKCADSSFKKTIKTKNPRSCYCRPREVAKKGDYPMVAPNLKSMKYNQVDVAPGLSWDYVNDFPMFESRQSFDLLVSDPKKRKMKIIASEGKLMRTPALVEMFNGLAGVNGGFHAYGTSVGSITQLKIDGKMLVEKDTVEQWDLTSEAVEGVLGMQADGRVKIVPTAMESEWKNLPSFLHTGPLLIYEGVRQPNDLVTWNNVRNPRTGVCILKNGLAVLFTVDGRYSTSAGMTIAELQVFLQTIGCQYAINLDGGGSTTMYIKGYGNANGVVNEPRDKGKGGVQFNEHLTLRSVSNAVMYI